MPQSFLPPVPEGRGGYRGPLIVLTERGYLRLVAHFKDPLSDAICEHALDTFFEARKKRAVNNHLNVSGLQVADQAPAHLPQQP
jgi:hypothetical protein